MRPILFLFALMVFSFNVSAQNQPQISSDDYLNMRWKTVATKMTEEWYGSQEARSVAENVLINQKDIGGWEKNKPYHHPFSDEEINKILENSSSIGATFDNGSTIMEMQFLANVYKHLKDERYKQAFEKGLGYIYEAQYENGGWPQFFPVREGKSVHYSAHITYNDNAMVNIMRLLEGVIQNKDEYSLLELNDENKEKARKAFDMGIQCILETQIRIDGSPTVWCAQHDEKTLAPADARTFELASFSGAESVYITLLLMDIDNPSDEIIAAIKGAVKWFEKHKIEGITLETEIDHEGRENLIIVEDKNAEPLWGRFYDLKTGLPFFCDRDGIKKNTMAEIGHERRNGYAWYTNDPKKVLKKYPRWKEKAGV